MTNREGIFSALFARVSSIAGVQTSSRRLTSWDDVPHANMPALYQLEHTQRGEWLKMGLPQKWSLLADLFLYLDVRDANAAGSGPQALNGFLDAIEAALEPDNFSTGCCTLGGLCTHCRINEIQIFEGVQGGTAVAIISVEILTT